MATKRTLAILVGLLLACLFTGFPININSGSCPVLYIISLTPTVNGTLVEIVTGPLHSPVNITTEIPYHIPQECFLNSDLCGVQHIETPSALNLYLPSDNGFIQFSYFPSNATTNYTYFPIQRNCSIVKAFHNTAHNKLLFDCVRFNGNQGTLIIAEADLADLTKDLRYSTQPDALSDSSGLSPPVYAPNANRIFCVESSELLSAGTRPTDFALSTQLEFPLPNCIRVKQIEAIDGHVYIYCENRRSWVVDANTRANQMYSNFTYPCSDSESVVVSNGMLFFNGSSRSLPFLTPIYGMCSFGTFLTQSSDDSIYRVDLTTLSVDNVTTCPEGYSCLKPFLNEARDVAAYYDHSLNSVRVLNLTGACGSGVVSLTSAPKIVHIATSSRRTECLCEDVPGTTGIPQTNVGAIIGPILAGCIAVLVVIGVALCIVAIVKSRSSKGQNLNAVTLYSPTSDHRDKSRFAGGVELHTMLISKEQVADQVHTDQNNNDRHAIADQI